MIKVLPEVDSYCNHFIISVMENGDYNKLKWQIITVIFDYNNQNSLIAKLAIKTHLLKLPFPLIVIAINHD